MISPLPEADVRALAALRLMRLIAGGLLIAMGGLFLVALLHHDAHPAWGYARAFAEAALVGGLADWFAVTALFRRPLGLPIPHTAIIPNSQSRIADALGEFVTVNFLAPSVIGAHLREQDLAGALGRQCADPVAARRIADGVMDALPSIADLLSDDVVSDFLRRQLEEASRNGRVSVLVGRGLALLTERGRHQVLLDAALDEAWRALDQHEPLIRARVREQTAWVWRLIALDSRASDALVGAIETTLQDIAKDPVHPARRRATEILQAVADGMQNSPQTQARVEALVADALAHPAVNSYLAELWRDLKAGVRAVADAPSADARSALADAITRFGEALLADEAVRTSLNQRMRTLVVEVAGRHGPSVGAMISATIRNWDASTVVAKLERSVGPDLQYIRINGTLIGGLIGLTIHQVSLWLT